MHVRFTRSCCLEGDLDLAGFPTLGCKQRLGVSGPEPFIENLYQIPLELMVIALAWVAKSHAVVIRRAAIKTRPFQWPSREGKKHQVSKGNWGYEDSVSGIHFFLNITLSSAHQLQVGWTNSLHFSRGLFISAPSRFLSPFNQDLRKYLMKGKYFIYNREACISGSFGWRYNSTANLHQLCN